MVAAPGTVPAAGAKATPKGPLSGAVNFMFLLMKAVAKDQNTLSLMQILDSKATEFAVKLETAIYKFWYGPGGPIDQDQKEINKAANKGKTNEVNKYQALFNQQSARASSNAQKQDGVVQSCQGQTSADASNLEMKARMIQGVNSIVSTLSNMLGRIVG